MRFTLRDNEQFDLVLEVVVSDADSKFSGFLEDEKIPPRKGVKTNIRVINSNTLRF